MIVAKGSLLENAKNGCKLAATFGKSLQELQRKFGSWQPAASLHWDAPYYLSLSLSYWRDGTFFVFASFI